MTVLIDTGPLVGLINPRDEHFDEARSDLDQIMRDRLVLTLPVLTESLTFLRTAAARQKLFALLKAFHVAFHETSQRLVTEAIQWMNNYADHEPDFADALTVILSTEIPDAAVWTFDSEFRTIWRRPDGSAIPMAIKG